MSAGGSSTSFVFIKLATAKEDAFAKVAFNASDLVTDVADRACKKYTHWRLNAAQVRIHLVAESGNEPSDKAIEAALASKPLSVSAGVTSGAWLVAVPTTPARGSGGGSIGSSAKHTAEDLLAIAGVHPVQQSVLLRAAQRYGGMLTYAVTSGRADIAKEAYDMAAMLFCAGNPCQRAPT